MSIDPKVTNDYIRIHAVKGLLTCRMNVASHDCDRHVKDNDPECSISYEAGKRDAYKAALAWLVEYTRPI